MAELAIKVLEVGPLSTCCYLVSNEDSEDGVLIDPAGDADIIAREAEESGVKVRKILITHSHFDHIGAVAELKERWPEVEVLCHSKCSALMQSPQTNLSGMIGATVKAPPPTSTLEDGDKVTVGTIEISVLHLPGHSPGHLGFYIEADDVLFSGDTLFNGSLGRTDFPGSSYEVLAASLRDKVMILPDKTRVYPGHGPHTTIGRERRHNPFISDLL